MGILKQIGQYLYIVKKDSNDKSTQWMKYMHGINRLSILLFLFAMIVVAIKLIRN
jgi:cob(I)alamin adenosyltransferase